MQFLARPRWSPGARRASGGGGRHLAAEGAEVLVTGLTPKEAAAAR